MSASVRFTLWLVAILAFIGHGVCLDVGATQTAAALLVAAGAAAVLSIADFIAAFIMGMLGL